MEKRCYFCGTDMGVKDGNDQAGVFHSLCLDCAYRLRLDKKLPEFISSIAFLRKQNGYRELNQELVAPAAIRQT